MNRSNWSLCTLTTRAAHSLLLMALLAFALRVSGMFFFHTYIFSTVKSEHSTTPPEFSFGGETGSIAASLARGEGFSSPFGHQTGPTAWVAPVYPTLVAGVFKVLGIYSRLSAIALLSLNSAFAALTCIPIVVIGRRTLGNSCGLLAGWLWSLVPVYMTWPITWVWDMSMSALLMALLILSTLLVVETESRKRWAAYGLLWGAAALSNPALLSTLPLSLLWIAIKRWRKEQPYAICVLLILAALVACTAPWMIRNKAVLGEVTFLRDNFWFEFHMGNYHLSNGMGWGGKHPTGNIRELNLFKNLGELDYIEHYRAESINFVVTYPREFVELTKKRFVTFWTGDFFYYRWWETSSYVALSFFGLLGLILGIGNRACGVLLFANAVLFYPVVYYLTFPFPRYRHAIEPEMLLLSSYFLCELVRNFRDRFSRRKSSARIEEAIQMESQTA